MEGLDLIEHGIHAYPPSFVTGVAPVVKEPAAASQPIPAIENA
jgi:hypothetical protein